MKMRTLFPIFLMLIVPLGTGCQSGTISEKKAESEHVGSAAFNTEERVVEQIKINEAPQNSSSPGEAAIHQFEVIFDKGKSVFPEENSIISETVLGEHGILTIRSPEGKNQYAVFVYHKNEDWIMDGLLRLGAKQEKSFTDTEGLDLPMKNFNADKILVEKDGGKKEVWAFVDEENIITIARFETFSFDEPSGTKKVSLSNGTDAYISKDAKEHHFLYYYDTGKLVVVSGNLPPDQILELANSLPSVTVPNFPAVKE